MFCIGDHQFKVPISASTSPGLHVWLLCFIFLWQPVKSSKGLLERIVSCPDATILSWLVAGFGYVTPGGASLFSHLIPSSDQFITLGQVMRIWKPWIETLSRQICRFVLTITSRNRGLTILAGICFPFISMSVPPHVLSFSFPSCAS